MSFQLCNDAMIFEATEKKKWRDRTVRQIRLSTPRTSYFGTPANAKSTLLEHNGVKNCEPRGISIHITNS